MGVTCSHFIAKCFLYMLIGFLHSSPAFYSCSILSIGSHTFIDDFIGAIVYADGKWLVLK